MKNRKVVFAFILMAVIAVTACAQHDPESDFEASPRDDGKSVVITKYIGSKWEVRIPPRIQGLPVTHIGGDRFVGAFSGKNLISVTIPNSVTHIEDWAFSSNKLASITIPNSVTNIGANAFSGNPLTSITIPSNVTNILEKASIDMLGNVFSMGGGAFSGCESLTTINVAAGNSTFTSENGVLYNKNKTILYKYPPGKTDSSFIIPNSVTSIDNYAFIGCTDLTSITLPNSVTSIGDYTFYGCSGLTSITIPNSVTSIGEGAFDECTGLTGRFLEILRPIVEIMDNYESLPAQERRDRFDDILSATLSSQPNIVSIFTVWKPNVLADWRANTRGNNRGYDSDYIGRAGSTPTGQYASSFIRENGIIEKRLFTDVDDTMAYLNGPNSERELVEPTPFTVNGQEAWILRIEIPIINPRTYETVGTVGGYCDIR